MLEKLDKQQEKLIYSHRRDFIDFIMNNGKHCPKNLELTKELRDDIDWVYKKAGLQPPKFILVAGSFWEEKLMINAVFHMFGKEALNQVRNQVYNQVSGQVEDQVWDQVRNQVRNQVEDQVYNQVSGQVRNQVSDQVHNQVHNQVRDQVNDQVENQVNDQVRSQVRSQVRDKKLEWVEQGFGLPWNSYWFSFYTYFRSINIVKSQDFDHYYGLVKNHGLWSIQYFQDWCIVTQLPKIIRRDDENRLHSVDGPVIEWRNGQKDYYIHGVYFEPELWERVVSGNADPKTILKIENQEQRQAALSVVPLKTLLDKMGAVCISEFKKPKPKLSKKYVLEYEKLDYSKSIKLYLIMGEKFGIDESVKVVNYFCPSTGREYFDFVPYNIEKAEEGMVWKFGFENIKDYIENLVVET